MPASARASRAASTPYSTKLRPHLPHGVMPTPATIASPIAGHLPLPHELVLEEGLDDELDGGDGERLVRVGRRHVGRRRLVPGVGIAPDGPGRGEPVLVELGAGAPGVGAEGARRGEGDRGAGGAAPSEERGPTLGGEPP